MQNWETRKFDGGYLVSEGKEERRRKKKEQKGNLVLSCEKLVILVIQALSLMTSTHLLKFFKG